MGVGCCEYENGTQARKSMSRKKWTPEEELILKDLTWKEGMTATQVAEHTGNIWGRRITRNMVLGVLHRNGWAGAAKENPAQSRSRRKSAASARRAKPPQFGFASPKSSVIVREAEPLPVEDRKPDNCYALTHTDPCRERPDHTCQWFYGDPLVDPVGFCPADKIPGLPYCSAHASKAFMPVEVRSRSVPSSSVSVKQKRETVQ
jgi:GcrA cell cycle regulator